MTHSRSRALAQAEALPRLARVPSRRTVIWTKAHDDLLGVASDRHLAEIWGVDEGSVYQHRRLLAIPAHGKGHPFPWTPVMVAMLYTDLDHTIAQRFGISTMRVAIRRREMRIPNRGIRHNQIVWTPAMIAQLGKREDGDIAKDYGLARPTVSAQRRSLGIARLRPTKVNWSSSQVIRLMGSASDRKIAQRLGVDGETVRTRRTAAGIPPYEYNPWTASVIARLGTVPDRLLAEEIGVTPSAVGWNRRRLGVPTWDKRRKKTTLAR